MVSRKLQKFISEHPHCCFCGGLAPTTEEDHVPSRQFFHERRRPNQLVVPSCSTCNRSTAPSEQVVAVLARATRSWTSVGLDDQRTEKMISAGLGQNAPEVLEEWSQVSARQRRRWKALKYRTGLDCFPLNAGPLTHRHVQTFAAKLACALYYHETQKILSSNGGVAVIASTTEQLAKGNGIPSELRAQLGPNKTLAQGKEHVGHQFKWAGNSYTSGAVFVVDLGITFTLILWIAEDVNGLNVVLKNSGYVHRPGNLTSYHDPKLIGSLHHSWQQVRSN